MTIQPDRLPGDHERIKWKNVPKELLGRFVSLDALMETFPANGTHSGVTPLQDRENYTVYGIRLNEFVAEPLAYQCKACTTIVIGPPEIKDAAPLERRGGSSRVEGFDLYCQWCRVHLDEYSPSES